jgi:hypothetical protein
MSLELRDELALRLAAAMAGGARSPRLVADRAYAIADALLATRATLGLPAAVGEHASEDADARLDALPHDPRWEVDPRWSEADRRAAESARGPGLASARDVEPAAAKKLNAG